MTNAELTTLMKFVRLGSDLSTIHKYLVNIPASTSAWNKMSNEGAIGANSPVLMVYIRRRSTTESILE